MQRSVPVRRAAALLTASLMGALFLSGCATRAQMAATESPTPTETSSPSVTPTPVATEEAVPVPVPAPTESAAGHGTTVMFVTLDLVAGTLEASGMLPDVVEEGGTCTLTLQRGSETKMVSGPTATGPESTYCSLLTVPAADLARGEWTATLSYRSDAHVGTSAAATVSVP